MTLRQRTILLFLGVIIATILAAFFVFPDWLGSKYSPWRLGLDLVGGSNLVYEVDMKDVASGDRDSVMNGLRDVMERRVNAFGVSEPQVYPAKEGNSYRLVVELAGIKDVKQAVDQIGRTALLNFREVKENASTTEYVITELTGKHLTKATVDQDPNTNKPRIDISFDSEGAKMFEDITARNIGKPLAIFLDNQLIEQPNVNEKISGGNAVITSPSFTFDEVRNLVNLFNAGALPAPINLVSQQTVSATLGFDSLGRAIFAGLIGTLAVILFMLLYYRYFGIFASIALLIYVALTLAVFKILGITMTLSGIAGFILSIGMAVDANILIFERTKEELRRGLSRTSAIEEGFRRAWTSIRDSNVSTILTALILYYFTSSFVRGFALTLLIGVFMSMFSAITVTKTMLRIFVKDKPANPAAQNIQPKPAQ